MTPIRRTVAAAALLLMPGAAAAQNPYAEQVTGYLDDMFESALGADYVLEGESHSWMIDGAEAASVVRLPAGRYVVIGACDNDCEDIDLAVSRMDTDEVLDSDREMDSFPVVEFSLDGETDVLIGMTMPSCTTTRCYAGHRWYRAGGEGGGGTDVVGSWEDQVTSQLDAFPLGEGMTLADQRTGLVEADAEHRFTLELGAGSYAGVAVCDYDCTDVDLLVYAADGTTVSSDLLEDDVPIVEFDILKGDVTYEFMVRMVECTTPSCGFGFRLYRDAIK